MSSAGTNTKEMSFWDHLEVLRWSIFRVLIILAVVFVGVFIALPHIFDSFILGATSSDFFVYRWFHAIKYMSNQDFHVDVININVATQFLTHISTSFWIALVVSFPFLIYEIWKFIKPALYENEKKGVRTAFLSGSVLFYAGCTIGYCVVFPFTFRFLTQYQVSQEIVNQISLNSYITNFLSIIFIMGVVFEIPMLAWVLSEFGILKKPFLKKYRRHAVVVLLALAAVITPSGDPFTLFIVFLPLYLLYELSILVVSDEVPEE